MWPDSRNGILAILTLIPNQLEKKIPLPYSLLFMMFFYKPNNMYCCGYHQTYSFHNCM